MRGNPEEGKRAGGRETVDETPDREENRGEKNFRTRIEREEKGERVREEGNRREGARREMRHAVLEGQIEGNRFSIKAGAVRVSGIRERERRGAERAENDSTRISP